MTNLSICVCIERTFDVIPKLVKIDYVALYVNNANPNPNPNPSSSSNPNTTPNANSNPNL